jgi:hypothetical protein
MRVFGGVNPRMRHVALIATKTTIEHKGRERRDTIYERIDRYGGQETRDGACTGTIPGHGDPNGLPSFRRHAYPRGGSVPHGRHGEPPGRRDGEGSKQASMGPGARKEGRKEAQVR